MLETALEPMIFRTLSGHSDYRATGRLVTDLNYSSCLILFLIVFISYLQQTQEKIQRSSFMVRQQTEFVKYVLFVRKDRGT